MKREYVYTFGDGEGHFKIGVSADPDARMRSLQTAHWAELQFLYFAESDRAYEVEAAMHRLLREHRLKGEWFACEEEAIDAAYDFAWREIHGHGINLCDWPEHKLAALADRAKAKAP